jgi:hypothetical protein
VLIVVIVAKKRHGTTNINSDKRITTRCYFNTANEELVRSVYETQMGEKK